MPKIPLYNQGLGQTVTTKPIQGVRANEGAFTAAQKGFSEFGESLENAAFQFQMEEKKAETDRVGDEETLSLQNRAENFRLNNKDTDTATYEKNWKKFQNKELDRLKQLPLTKSQLNTVTRRLLPIFSSESSKGKINAYNRGQNIRLNAANALNENNISKASDLPIGHPDRDYMIQQIDDNITSSFKKDLNLKDNSVSARQRIAKLSYQKRLAATDSTAELFDIQFDIERDKDLTAGDLKAFSTQIETTRNRIRDNTVAALTTVIDDQDITNGNITNEGQINERYDDAAKSEFGGNQIMQQQYRSLDDKGKADFRRVLAERRSASIAQLNFTQRQSDRRDDEANETLYTDNIKSVVSGTMSIVDIRNLDFKGEKGQKYREQLTSMANKVASGTVLTDSKPLVYQGTSALVLQGKVTDVTQKYKLMTDPSSVPPEGLSLLDRFGDGLSSIDIEHFAGLITSMKKSSTSLDSKERTKAYQAFATFAKAQETSIKGSNAFRMDPKRDQRFYDFEIQMRVRFEEGLAKGISYIDLLNPRHPNYLVRPDDMFAPTKQEQLQNITEQFKDKLPATLQDVRPPARLPGQSPQDYLASEVYKTWVTSGKPAIYRKLRDQ